MAALETRVGRLEERRGALIIAVRQVDRSWKVSDGPAGLTDDQLDAYCAAHGDGQKVKIHIRGDEAQHATT
jgi:hypothetical protein